MRVECRGFQVRRWRYSALAAIRGWHCARTRVVAKRTPLDQERSG